MKTQKRWAGILAIIIFCLLISGCWDRREPQDRNFVMAASVDTAGEGAKAGQTPAGVQAETFVQGSGPKQYRLSLQLLRFQPAGPQASGPKGDRTFVISDIGSSLFEIERDLLGQSSKSLYFEHIQSIVLSEAVVRKHGLRPLLDFFMRDSEMRWRIKLFITSGEARKVLDYQPPSGEPGGIYMANIVKLHTKDTHVGGEKTDLGFAIQNMDNQAVVLIPRLELVDNILKIGGMAVVKNDKFLGYADEYAVQGAKFVLGTEKSAVVTVECPNHPGQMQAFELFIHDTKLKPHVVDGHIYFTLDIFMRGNLNEMQNSSSENTFDPEYLHKLEVRFAEEVKRSVLYSHDVFYNQMGADAFYLGSKLQAYEPEVWQQVKDQWDTIAPSVPIEVSVNVTILNIGEHK